jgi:peptidylprolyl isomerase
MDAYGPSDPQNTVTLPRTQLPPDLNSELFVGMSLNMHQENGHVVTVNVTNLTETDVTLDANHELAGKDLIFDLELMAIN